MEKSRIATPVAKADTSSILVLVSIPPTRRPGSGFLNRMEGFDSLRGYLLVPAAPDASLRSLTPRFNSWRGD